MTRPIRIQRKRTKGYDMQAESRAINGLDCVYVGRPTFWGNPYKANSPNDDHLLLRNFYGHWLSGQFVGSKDQHNRTRILNEIGVLSGKNLSCFCALDQPCHADVLLELANR